MSRGVRREGLSRRHRFRGPDAFRPLLRSPRKFSGTFAVVHVVPTAAPGGRFGISVGRRAARKAVDRNYVKRRARETFRQHPVKRAPVDVVVTLTSRFEMTRVDALSLELRELLDRVASRLSS